ncbi:MAG: GtrA family protein, partial [Oricola sp.]
MTAISEPRETVRRHSGALGGLEPVILALLGALFVTLMGLRSGDTGIPNSDDLVRLVEVRDLLAGQGWFDLTQYRLGLDGGTPMHWSRLVDAPIAAIIAAASWITGDTVLAEAAAKIVWPAATAFLALMALMTACARTSNARNRLPVAVIGAVALWTIGVFAPGSLDHHNIQVALSLWLLALLLPGARPVASHAAAGPVAVAMLAIGMEVLPYVATAGAVVASRFVFGAVTPAQARAFGLSVAVSALAIFLGTIAPSDWRADACDAYSGFHLVTGATGGLGLLVASFLSRSALARLAAAVVLGIAVVAVVAIVFPHCLENPLASLDPRLRRFWLEGVVETRSLADLLSSDPFAIVGLFGMACVAFLLVAISGVTGRPLPKAQAAVFAAFLAMGIAVTTWQQRGFTFATAFAVLPLGFWIGHIRAAMPEKRSPVQSLRLAGAWLVSINLVWWIAGSQLAALFSSVPTLQEQAAAASPRDYCYTADLYAPLAAEPDGVVLGATDIGASILLYTHHRAIAGPYHRDVPGILFLIDTMLAAPDTARAMLREQGVTLVADCVNAADGNDFIAAAPRGFQAVLRGPDRPDWLE